MSRHEPASEKCKQSLYFPATMIAEMQVEAKRLDRSLSWIVQRCVRLALAEVKALPSQVPEAAE